MSTADPGRHLRSSQKWPFLRKLTVLNFSFYLPGLNVRPERGSKNNRDKFILKYCSSLVMSLSKLQEIVKDREAWHAAVRGAAESGTRLNKQLIFLATGHLAGQPVSPHSRGVCRHSATKVSSPLSRASRDWACGDRTVLVVPGWLGGPGGRGHLCPQQGWGWNVLSPSWGQVLFWKEPPLGVHGSCRRACCVFGWRSCRRAPLWGLGEGCWAAPSRPDPGPSEVWLRCSGTLEGGSLGAWGPSWDQLAGEVQGLGAWEGRSCS